MFIVLVVFFLLNLLYSIWKFKVMINPATLFGLGFAIAGVMCMYFYDEWIMKTFRTDTFYVFFIGTLLFTGTCALMCPKTSDYISKEHIENVPMKDLYAQRLFILLVIAVAIQAFVCYYKYKVISSTYGGFLAFSELVYTAHMDAREGEDLYPWWFKQVGGAMTNIAPFIYLVSGVFVAKGAMKGRWLLLFIAYLSLTILDSALNGGKGGAIQAVIIMIIAWYIKYIRIKHRFNVRKKVLALIGGMGVAVFLGINIMNYWVGRGDENNTLDVAMYAGAVYCGAELKNMDIYMRSPKSTEVWGQNTFRRFYNMLDDKGLVFGYKDKRYESGALKPFLSVHGYNLGNVYTLFCDLYWDFGWWGLLWMPVMAIILMIFFRKIFTSPKPVAQVSIWEFFYLSMAWHTFMSFFSNRFFEAYCNPLGIIKTLIYFYIIDFILRRWFYLQKEGKRTMVPNQRVQVGKAELA